MTETTKKPTVKDSCLVDGRFDSLVSLRRELAAFEGELQKALESINKGSKDEALDLFKKDLEQQTAQKTKKWEEKRKKYHKEIEDLKKKLKEREEEIKSCSDTARKETDSSLFEERRKADKMSNKFQEDHDKLREELTGEMSRLKAEYDEKIDDYEEVGKQQSAGCRSKTIIRL